MKKRLISLILVLCMLFPTCAYAVDIPAEDEHEKPAPVVTEQAGSPEEEPAEALAEVSADPIMLGSDECSHANGEPTDAWWYDFDEEQAVDNEDGTHTVPGYLVTEWHCDDCGEDYEVRAEEAVPVTDTHYFFRDACTICGTKNPCNHSTGEQEVYKKTRENDTDSIEDNKDGTHSVKYRYYTEYICHNCSSEYVVYDQTWTGPVNENHIWNMNDSCSVCWTVNPCQHPNLITSEIKKVGRYYQYDESVHTATGGVYTLYSCTDCGMAYEDYQREFIQDEEHDFSNGNCPCGACGHVNAESTPDDSWETLEDAEDNGDGSHTGTLVTYTEYYCPDCNEYIVRVTGTQESVARNHEFDGDGLCSICGAENTCEHNGRQNTRIESRVDYDSIVSSDEKTHSYPSTLCTWTYCELCGQCIDRKYIEESPAMRLHRMIDGVCEDCGYTSDCQHENAHAVFSFYSDPELRKPEPIDGTPLHTVSGYVVVYEECLDCGQSTYIDSFESEATEAHHYNNNGCCYVCGQVNACEHENIAEQAWNDCGSAVDIGDNGHKVNAWTGIVRYCEYCNTTLGWETTSDIEEAVMPHRYERGVCTECGHVNLCTHEGAKTVTVREYTVLSYTRTQHTIYAQSQEQTICDCGEMISAIAAGDAEMITEDHTMVRNGAIMECDVCGYYTEAPSCTTHKFVKVKATAATCTEPGHKEYYECSVCGTPKTTPVEIPAKGHTEKVVPEQPVTCLNNGYSEYTICSVCGEILTVPEIYEAVGYHESVTDASVEGTCVTIGMTEGSHCSVCGEILEPQQKLGYGGHTYNDYECVYCGRVANIEYIEIGREEIDLGVKDTYQLAPFVLPEKAAGHLVYSSSNPAIAKVNGNGLITALKPGYASIRIMGDGQQESLDVYVYAGISKLVLNCKTMQMEIGQNSELSVGVTGYSANELTWSSSDFSIVDILGVENNNVKLVGNRAGTATIKVQASNGKNATCKVTVVDPSKLAGVKLSAEITNPFIGDQFLFIASTLPTFTEEDGVQISYKSSNPKVLSIDESTGNAEAKAAGTVTITATATKDNVKKSASMKITVTDPAKLTGLAVDGIKAKQTMYAGDLLEGYLVALPVTEQVAANVTYSVKVANPQILSAELAGDEVSLTALATGSTKVTFTATVGNVTKSFTSKITIEDPVTPRTVYIDGDFMPEMELGVPTGCEYSVYIDAERYDASAYQVTWKSSNTKVASVDSNGRLTILKPGTITLSVTVKYGKVTKTAKQKVTILDRSVLYTVTCKNNNWEGQVGGRLQLDTLILPYDLDFSTISVTYTTSSAKLATVDESGYVELLAPGTVTISVTAKQGKVTKTAKVKIKIVPASN